MPVHPDPLDLEDDETDHSISLCPLYVFRAPRPAARVASGSVIEMLHGELHGELSDEPGGAGSVFLGGSGDRVVGMGVGLQTSIEGPSTLAVEDRVSLS